MADLSVYGEAVFDTVPNRDRAEGLFEDFMQATEGTMPYGGQQNFAAGFERITQIHLDEFDGPGLRWCFRIPEELGMTWGDVVMELDNLALSWNAAAGSIT